MKIEVEKGDLSYANEMNITLSFSWSFTALDFNMFFTLCYFIKKDRFNDKIEIPFSALESFLPSKIKNKKRFHEDIVKFVDKIKLISKSRYLYFNLHEFCGIKSKYSKSVFRILIQFKNVKSNFKGEKELTLTKKQFRNLLSIPINFLKSSQILKL